jgi:hypothetical protein
MRFLLYRGGILHGISYVFGNAYSESIMGFIQLLLFHQTAYLVSVRQVHAIVVFNINEINAIVLQHAGSNPAFLQMLEDVLRA